MAWDGSGMGPVLPSYPGIAGVLGCQAARTLRSVVITRSKAATPAGESLRLPRRDSIAAPSALNISHEIASGTGGNPQHNDSTKIIL